MEIRIWLLAPVLISCLVTPPGIGAEPGGGSIRFDQLGKEAQRAHPGAAGEVVPSGDGARLRAVFQKLEAEATPEGLWLKSMSGSPVSGERLHVKAAALGRAGCGSRELARRGEVTVTADGARFERPGVREDYSVSVDGVRQDFVLTERPAGSGELRLVLEIQGAKAESHQLGARLTLADSGREIGYSRLQVFDAQGKSLPARMEVPAPDTIHLCVKEAAAVYPLRIDPTFSDADWIGMGGVRGVDGFVTCLEIGPDGLLYVGGDFNLVGENWINGIAKWDGAAWHALGSGFSGAVSAMVFVGNDLYVGGDLGVQGQSWGHVARWDGSVWHSLGTGVNKEVNSIAAAGGKLYAGGFFTTAGGQPASGIAVWDGTSWSAMGSGVPGTVYALVAVNETEVYAGGAYHAIATPISGIMKWNGSSWSHLGSGINGYVRALLRRGDDLYVGGKFSIAGGQSVQNLAKWNNDIGWSSLGASGITQVEKLMMWGDDLYIGGQLANSRSIAKWDGTTWTTFDHGPTSVSSLAVFNGDLFVSGGFSWISGQVCQSIARWDGAVWHALEPDLKLGVNGVVNAIAVAGEEIYIAGSFSMAFGVAANSIAKWDGESWSALGTGIGGEVEAIAVAGNMVYVGGSFFWAGSIRVGNVAQWNGTEWQRMGPNENHGPTDIGGIETLAVCGDRLFVGGGFTEWIPDDPFSSSVGAYLVQWDGTTWSAVGGGTNGSVNALASDGVSLYAGGSFTTAGGVTVNRIAKWNGNSWEPLGTGLRDYWGSGSVSALALDGNDLYIAGRVNYAGEVEIRGIGKWDGTEWSDYGHDEFRFGFNYISTIAVANGQIFVGGQIYRWRNLARRNGHGWSGLASGLNHNVHAVAVSGNHLLVGGEFLAAGGQISTHYAMADISRPVITLSGNDAPITNGAAQPAAADGTDFGAVAVSGGASQRTFVIANAGSRTLNLQGATPVTLSGANAADFAVTAPPALSVAPGESTSFTLTFDPGALGTKSAVVTITSDDTDSGAFVFTIGGEATGPGGVAFSTAVYTVAQGAAEVKVTVTRAGGSQAFQVNLSIADGPASAVPPYAAAVSGNDYQAPAPVLTFEEGELEKEVTISLVPRAGPQPNKHFSLSLSNPSDAAFLGSVASARVRILAKDTSKPTLTLTAPTAQVSAPAPFIVTGTAGDAKGIDRVEVSLNGAAPVLADLSGAKAPTAVPFSLPIMPLQGANTLVVTAYDLNGNSTSVTRNFKFERRYKITVLREWPNGEIKLTATPPAAATVLSGKGLPYNTRIATAVPGVPLTLTCLGLSRTDWIFRRWIGLPEGAAALWNVATFVMPAEDLFITSECIESPYFLLYGPRSGLLTTSVGTTPGNDLTGIIVGTMHPSGGLTGKIQVDGVTQSFSAMFFGDGPAVFLLGGGRRAMSLDFGGRSLTLEDADGAIHAVLRNARGTCEGNLERELYNSRDKVPYYSSKFGGLHTLAIATLPPMLDGSPAPAAHGYATADLSAWGRVRIAGFLADGTSITAAASLVTGDVAPFLVQLPTPGKTSVKGGSFSGRFLPLYITDTGVDQVQWFRPPAASASIKLYRDGWPQGLEGFGFGNHYRKDKTVQQGLMLPDIGVPSNAQITFRDGNLQNSVEKSNFLLHGNRIIKLSPGDPTFSLSFSQSGATFNGSFLPRWPGTGSSRVPFKGIIVQGSDGGGHGFFITDSDGDGLMESGSVYLRAPNE